MYSKIALFVASAFALAAMAAPGGTPPPTGSQCNTGSINCCNSVQDAESDVVQKHLGTLGVPVGDVTGQVGVNCLAASAIGLAGNGCSSQPVCCTGNNFSGLVVVGCSPINV